MDFQTLLTAMLPSVDTCKCNACCCRAAPSPAKVNVHWSPTGSDAHRQLVLYIQDYQSEISSTDWLYTFTSIKEPTKETAQLFSNPHSARVNPTSLVQQQKPLSPMPWGICPPESQHPPHGCQSAREDGSDILLPSASCTGFSPQLSSLC